jgi:putative DNA primase/helicase
MAVKDASLIIPDQSARLTAERNKMLKSLSDMAKWRWQGILLETGVSLNVLNGKHGPCPICGGKDRFRWDNKDGRGTWFCTHCGAGDGVNLVMKLKGFEFRDAAKFIQSLVPKCEAHITPAVGRSRGAQAAAMQKLWTKGRLLDGKDIASRYLAARGISFRGDPPLSLRYADSIKYTDDKREYPAMLAKFVSPDEKWATLHRTYLEEPGVKADVEKPRMLMPGGMPLGGAVRLGPASSAMGVAEGIETALSAALLHDMTVWATLGAQALIRFQPPKEVTHLTIFGDNDPLSYTGQMAAYSLAHKLSVSKDLKITVILPRLAGDWNDMLTREIV